MESLPKEILEMVFLNLPVLSIHTAMRVCKQWQDTVDQNFWRKYVASHFDLEENHRDEGSALHVWKVQDGLCNCSEDKLDETERRYMKLAKEETNEFEDSKYFTHYPKLLKCDIIIPYGFETKSITDYHQFAVAFAKAVLLKKAIRAQGIECNDGYGTVDVMIFDWTKADMPENEELLEMLHSIYYETTDIKYNDSISENQYSVIFEEREGDESGSEIDNDRDDCASKKAEATCNTDIENNIGQVASTSKPMDVNIKGIKDTESHALSTEVKIQKLLGMEFRPWIEKLFKPAALYSFGEELFTGGVNVIFLLTKLSERQIGGITSPSHY